MSTQMIHRSYNSPAGTLRATYTYHETKEKYRLDRLSLEKAGQTTQVALSKVWVNGFPASHLKGFKSHVMEEKAQFTLSGDTYDLTLPGFPDSVLSLTIKILGKEEQIITLKAPERLTVMGLKKIVAKKLATLDLGLLNLKYQGKALDASNTLEECDFKEGTELTLSLLDQKEKQTSKQEKIGNDALEMCTTLNFVIPDTTKTILFSKNAPRWRTVSSGLSLKAECTNKACKAFENIVYVNKGMGVFNMAKECCDAKCPECKEEITKEINNCGFYNCNYSIEGKMSDGIKFKEENKTAPKDAYLTFEEVVEGKSKMGKWLFLEITTKPSK